MMYPTDYVEKIFLLQHLTMDDSRNLLLTCSPRPNIQVGEIEEVIKNNN